MVYHIFSKWFIIYLQMVYHIFKWFIISSNGYSLNYHIYLQMVYHIFKIVHNLFLLSKYSFTFVMYLCSVNDISSSVWILTSLIDIQSDLDLILIICLYIDIIFLQSITVYYIHHFEFKIFLYSMNNNSDT